MSQRRSSQPSPREAEPVADTLWCSFCGAAEAEVHKMIAGDRAQICDRCVKEAVTVVLDHATDSARSSERLDAGSAMCGFCHAASLSRSILVGTDHVVICEQCLAGILVAVAEEHSAGKVEPIVLRLRAKR